VEALRYVTVTEFQPQVGPGMTGVNYMIICDAMRSGGKRCLVTYNGNEGVDEREEGTSGMAWAWMWESENE
jgi:hypothetical protein